MTIYLDNAATTPLFPEVIELINDLNSNLYANPSSLHSQGRKAKKELNKAREYLASTINCSTDELIFTSGATEANNFVFKALDFDLIITSPSEHPCVLEPAKATTLPIIWLSLNKEGFIDLTELEKLLEDFKSKKILVSIMHGNNEIGTVQNLEKIGKLKSKYPNCIFHSDCVQTYTKRDIDVKKFNLDCISSSAHKIHGPKGVGFMYMKKTLLDEINLRRKSLIIGGGQENNHRSGTENLIGILAFAKAVKINLENEEKKKNFTALWKSLYYELEKIPGVVIHGPKDLGQRVLGNLNLSFSEAKLNSEEMVLQLDLAGLAASTGSACSSNKLDSDAQITSSYILRACAIDDKLAKKAIRLSVSQLNTREELDQAIKIINKVLSDFLVLNP